MVRRVPWFARLPQVSLPVGEAGEYRLRGSGPAGGLSTLEAIARAFGIIEGPAVQAQLERVLRTMVERTLFSRGALARDRVFGGLSANVVNTTSKLVA